MPYYLLLNANCVDILQRVADCTRMSFVDKSSLDVDVGELTFDSLSVLKQETDVDVRPFCSALRSIVSLDAVTALYS